ncbi:MAG: hypothetical protein Unbinned200contig1002_14 [Prokaryotic dsDNA virus sp.]|jgi:hypothetical protein|nr:hypothetical protein [Flavobacteriaceae bacterium]QDP68313.1 MAG: hypothetical protein Unbinned200contig1002_14 [Prokaryotic dsDNA virus sp.]|tara:strand:- start:16398 stop:18548 length:2151 start_codon:yes stop_codon:yes gene_type:complete
MTEFYQKVETPTTDRRVQSAAPTGPERDLQAEYDAQKRGFADSIRGLLGVANTTVENKIVKDRKELEDTHGLDAKADANGYADYNASGLETKAKADGKEFADLTDEDILKYSKELKDEYIESKGLNNKPYFELINEQLDQKNSLLLEKHSKQIRDAYEQKQGQILSEDIIGKIRSDMSPEDLVTYIDETLNERVGPEKSIRATREEILEQLSLPLMQEAVTSGNPKLLSKLKSGEMKKVFGSVPAYDNIISMAEKKATSIVSAQRENNFKTVEEEAYVIADSGGFLTDKNVDQFIQEKMNNIPEEYRPSAKDIFTLKQKMYKGVSTGNKTKEYLDAVKQGDYTYLERQDWKEKEKDEVHTQAFSTLTGINDLSPQGITEAMADDQMKYALTQYYKEGGDHPKEMKAWAKTQPRAYTDVDPVTGEETVVNFADAMRIKVNTYEELSAATASSATSIDSAFDVTDLSRMTFMKNLLEGIDSNSVNAAEAQEIYSNFNTNLEKKIDSWGRFRDPDVDAKMSQAEISEWSTEVAGSSPEWTWDEFSTPRYVARTLENNVSMFLAGGMDVEEAQEKAEEMFNNTHLKFESPDGSESAIGGDFVSFRGREEAFAEVAANLPQLQSFKTADTYLGNDYVFRNRISIRPTSDFQKTKQIEVFYDGKRVANTRMSYDTFTNNYDKLQTKEKKRIEKEYLKSLTKERKSRNETLDTINKSGFAISL